MIRRLASTLLLCLLGVLLMGPVPLALATDTEPTASETTPATSTEVEEAVVPSLAVEIPGVNFTPVLEKGGYLEIDFIGTYIAGMFRWLLGIGTTIAIVFVMVAGLRYAVSAGTGNIESAKKMINNAITGLALLMCVYMILFLINPQLTFLKPITVENISLIPLPTEGTDRDIDELDLPECASQGTNGVPYYCQRNYGKYGYGINCKDHPTIATSGCGPTAMAMVMSYYEKPVTPIIAAASFQEGHRICGVGTAYSAFTSASIVKDHNMQTDVIWGRTPNSATIPSAGQTKITELLRENKPVIISVGPSRFTGSGHFMVLTGIQDESTFLLNDPNSGYSTVTTEELWPIIKYAAYVRPR